MANLLKGKAKISDAERTIALALASKKRGDLRLAASRAITAVVIAARSRSPKRADKVVKEAREIMQSIVLDRMPGTIKGLMSPARKDLVIECEHIEVMIFTLTRGGVPFNEIRVSQNPKAVVVPRKYASMAKKTLWGVTGGKTRTILKVS